jgi:tRNA nucleotidyltransferase/poly(A) polymerase
MAKSKSNPVILHESEIDTTLKDLDTLALAISPGQEAEQKVEIIEEVQSLAVLNEQKLKAEQQKARLEIEVEKLRSSRNLSKAINSLIDLGLSEEILSGITRNLKTALDLKLYSEAIKNFTEARNKNADSIMQDEFGGRKKTKIMAAFKAPTGEQMMIAAELPDNS